MTSLFSMHSCDSARPCVCIDVGSGISHVVGYGGASRMSGMHQALENQGNSIKAQSRHRKRPMPR